MSHPARRGGRRAWAIAILAVIAVGSGLLALRLARPHLDRWVQARLRAELARALGRPVSIGSVEVSIPGLSIVAREIVVGETPPRTRTVLEVPEVSLVLALRSLWTGRLQLESVDIEAPVARFRRVEGAWEGPIPRGGEERTAAQARARGRTTLVLHRLRISRGRLGFEDASLPLSFAARDLSVGWRGDEKGNGEGEIDASEITLGVSGAALGRLQARASLKGERIEGSARAAWGESSAELEGSLILPPSGSEGLVGDLKTSLHLAADAPGLALLKAFGFEEPVSGTLTGSGMVRMEGNGWQAEGRMRGREIRLHELLLSAVELHLVARPGSVEARTFEVGVLDGRVKGAAQLRLGEAGSFHLSAEGERVSLNKTLELIGLHSPLEGTASIAGEASLRLGHPDSLRVRATTAIAGGRSHRGPRVAPGAAGRFDTEGTGVLQIDGRKVVFSADRARSESIVASLSVFKDLDLPEVRLRLAADLARVSEGSALVDAFLAAQDEGDALPWDSERLEGRGTVEADLLFTEEGPVRGSGSFAFQDLSYESIGHGALAGSAAADGRSLSLAAEAEKRGGTASLEASIAQSPGAPSRVTGRFHAWPAEDVIERLALPGEAAVRVSGEAEYRFGGDEPEADARFDLSDARVFKERFERGRLRAALRGDRLNIPELALEGSRAEVASEWTYDIPTDRIAGRLRAPRIDAAVGEPWLRGLPVAGQVAVELEVESAERGLTWRASLTPSERLALAGQSISQLTLSLKGDSSSAQFQGRFDDVASFSGELALEAPHEGEGRIEIRELPISQVLAVWRPDLAVQVSGLASGDVTWSGPLDDVALLRAQASFGRLRAVLGSEAFEAVRPARLSLREGRVFFDDVEMTAGGSQVRVGGSYPLGAGGRLAVDLTGNVDLGALAAFVPDLIASGTLRARIRAEGAREAPDLLGTLSVENGRVRSIGFPLIADQIRLDARLEPSGIVSDAFAARLGGGEMTGRGRVDLDGLTPTGFLLEARVSNVTLAMPEGFKGQYTGELRWRQSEGSAGSLSGDLELLRGIWDKDFELDRFTVGGRIREPIALGTVAQDGLQRTALAIRVRAEENLWCHNDLADVEGRAELALRGTFGAPELTGRFEAFEGGEMRFRRVRYLIDQATVNFPEGPVFNPDYAITAETRIREYDVRMHLSGNLERLEYELSSNPPLPPPQILSLLLTGSAAPDEGLAAGSAPLAGAAASVVGGEIGSLVGERLERWLGFEEVRIEPLLAQGTTADPTTRLTLAKRISPRLFVKTAVSLNSPEEPIYQVEYLLSRNIRLLAERGELGALGGDIKYSTRFFSPFGRSPAARNAQATADRRRMINQVRFQGDNETPARELQRIAGVRKGKEFTRRVMVEGSDRLKKRYVRQGYLEASIRPSVRDARAGGVNILYKIERGPRVEVKLRGAGSYDRRIREALRALWLEPSFGGDMVSEGEEKIRRLLQAEGHYACYVRSSTEVVKGVKQVAYDVDSGEKVAVRSVKIEGMAKIPEADIRRQVLTGEEALFRREILKPDTLAADLAAIESLYRSRGFLHASARPEVSLSPDGREAFVVIAIEEGPPARLKEIRVAGNESVSEEAIRELITSRPGEPFLPAQVLSDRESIQSHYDLLGYPEAQVAQELTTEGEEVNLTVRITEGERKLVRGVRIAGNSITNDRLIRREVPFEPGQPISAARIREARQRLMKTGLFSSVQVSYEDSREGKGQILNVHVREAESLVLGLGGGFDTEQGPRGTLLVANSNLWGRGQYGGLSAVYGRRLERVQLTFREPRPFEWPFGTTLSSFYEKRRRESFTQRQVGGSFLVERKTGGPVSHHLRYAVSISEVFDLRVPISTFRDENFRIPLERLRLASAGYAIVRDARNDPVNTTRGTYGSVDLRLFGEPVGSEKRFAKLFLQGNLYKPLPLGLNWTSSVRVGMAWRGMGEPIPLQERFFAGGDSTVRGFGQDRLGYVATEAESVRRDTDGDGTPDTTIRQLTNVGTLENETLRPLGGESLVIVNNELRRRIYGGFSATLFLDAGNVYPRPTDLLDGRLRTTAGVGLRLDTPVGPLRVEYGWKLDRERGESPGEFVFSLGQTF